MTTSETPPIACTLAPGEFRDRVTWIATINRETLRSYDRRDLVLELRYAPQAIDRVRELVRREQACCTFLRFNLQAGAKEVTLTVTAPEVARIAADQVFEQFVEASGAVQLSRDGC